MLVFALRAQADILHKNDSSTFSTGGIAWQQNFDLFVEKVSNEVTYVHVDHVTSQVNIGTQVFNI